MIAIAFYLLAFIAIASALMVVVARNPVHSVMFLIVTFFTAAGLFILMGAEFLALLLVMVYVGAVAVLFLFVVMMLDVDFVSLRSGFANNMPMGLIVASILLLELFMVGAAYFSDDGSRRVVFDDGKNNLERFGEVLYTEYSFFFEAAGIILLVAMVGAIGLTLRDRPNVRRQNANDQIARTREEGVELLDVPSGEGLG